MVHLSVTSDDQGSLRNILPTGGLTRLHTLKAHSKGMSASYADIKNPLTIINNTTNDHYRGTLEIKIEKLTQNLNDLLMEFRSTGNSKKPPLKRINKKVG